MEFFFAWIIFSIVAGVIASARGRSGIGYFFLSLVLSPLIGIILVALLPSLTAAPGAPRPETHVRCPECAEPVLREAKKCKHCGAALTPAPFRCGSCHGVISPTAMRCMHCGVKLAPAAAGSAELAVLDEAKAKEVEIKVPWQTEGARESAAAAREAREALARRTNAQVTGEPAPDSQSK